MVVAELLPDSLSAWMHRYQQMAVRGVRSQAVAQIIARHLDHFAGFFQTAYGHDRISACLKRDVLAWRGYLRDELGFAPSTVNSYVASLSAFATWVAVQDPHVFPEGDPTNGIGELPLPALEARTLSDEQVRSLKNICDRLDTFYRQKGRRQRTRSGKHFPLRKTARPLRDRAIVFVLLSTGLRREELIQLNLDQLDPANPEGLREARKARIRRVRGKGKTERMVYLSTDARQALADYLEYERPQDADERVAALFLSAARVASRRADGRLSTRVINHILEQIGQWHDAEQADPARHISPLRPHDLRHTFAFRLARVTHADAYELERRLGHRSQRYIKRYTNPPEDTAAGYVEDF